MLPCGLGTSRKKSYLLHELFFNELESLERAFWPEKICFSKARAWIVYIIVKVYYTVCAAWVLSGEYLRVEWKIEKEIKLGICGFVLLLLARAAEDALFW